MSTTLFASQLERDSWREPVIATLEASGIPRDDMFIFGGSVLALAGIRPATDVDIVVRQNLYYEMYETGQLPASNNWEEDLSLTVYCGPGIDQRLVTGPSCSLHLPLDISMIVEWEDDGKSPSPHFYEKMSGNKAS